jgi:hypothetical protein
MAKPGGESSLDMSPKLEKYISEKTITLPNFLFRWNKRAFDENEKREFFEEKKKKNEKFKIGLIRTKELDTYVNVLGEIFDFSKTASRKKNNINTPLSNSDKEKINKEVKEKFGFDVTGNSEEELIPVPSFYFVNKDFDRLYLGWLDTDSDFDDTQKKVIRSVMKQLFRFIFGTKKIKDVNDFFTKQRIAYTALEPEDKIPCESKILIHFIKSLKYRLQLLTEEINTASEVYKQKTLYVEKKQLVKIKIEQLLMEIYAKNKCIDYSYDPSMKSDKLSADEEMITRLIKVFKQYIQEKRYKNSSNYSLEKFRKDLQFENPDDNRPDTELYNELVTLLSRLSEDSEDVDELEDLVTYLSYLLIVKNTLFKIQNLMLELKSGDSKGKGDLLKELDILEQGLQQLSIPAQQTDSLQSLLLDYLRAVRQGNPTNELKRKIEDKFSKQNPTKGGGDIINNITNPPTHVGGGDTNIKIKTPKDPKLFCESLLSLLLLQAHSESDFDVQDFLNTAGATMDDLGQCPLVVHFLEQLMDSVEEKQRQKGITYYPIERESELIKSLEKSFHNRFNDSQKEFLTGIGKSVILFPSPPKEFQEYMGRTPYILEYNDMDDLDEVPFHGFKSDEGEENIILTREEQEKIEKGGIPYGALMFLYLTALRDFYSLHESPAISSKCLTPIRTIERAKTPKSKEKKVLRKTRVKAKE